MVSTLLSFCVGLAMATSSVREVSSTACKAVRVNLGLGMTTQLVFDQEPKVTLFADKKHFRINSNGVSPRSLAIIPYVEESEINVFRTPNGRLPSHKVLAQNLDGSFKTNLFVIFGNDNQLMFDLRFVEKNKADYILKVTQKFDGGCQL